MPPIPSRRITIPLPGAEGEGEIEIEPLSAGWVRVTLSLPRVWLKLTTKLQHEDVARVADELAKAVAAAREEM